MQSAWIFFVSNSLVSFEETYYSYNFESPNFT